MPSLPSPSVRSLRARLGGYALAASHDPAEYTKAARETFRQRFEDEVDPARELDDAERARRTEAARRAFYTRLALKSATARASKKKRATAAHATAALRSSLATPTNAEGTAISEEVA